MFRSNYLILVEIFEIGVLGSEIDHLCRKIQKWVFWSKVLHIGRKIQKCCVRSEIPHLCKKFKRGYLGRKYHTQFEKFESGMFRSKHSKVKYLTYKYCIQVEIFKNGGVQVENPPLGRKIRTWDVLVKNPQFRSNKLKIGYLG